MRNINIKEQLEETIESNTALINLDLSHQDLTNISLDEGRFEKARFVHSNLTGANMSYALFENCDFSGAALYNVCFSYSRFVNCSFEAASFGGTDIVGAEFENCAFSTLSCFSLEFSQTAGMTDCAFLSPQGQAYPMTKPPVVIKGLKTGTIVFLDTHVKTGAVICPQKQWWQKLNIIQH